MLCKKRKKHACGRAQKWTEIPLDCRKCALNTQNFLGGMTPDPLTGLRLATPVAHDVSEGKVLLVWPLLQCWMVPAVADYGVPWKFDGAPNSQTFISIHSVKVLRLLSSPIVEGYCVFISRYCMPPPLASEKPSYYSQRDPDPWQSWFAKWCNIQYISMGTRANHRNIVLT